MAAAFSTLHEIDHGLNSTLKQRIRMRFAEPTPETKVGQTFALMFCRMAVEPVTEIVGGTTG